MSRPAPKKLIFPPKILPWLDIVAITAWGILFLVYWGTGKLALLIHPNYSLLTVITGVVLLLVAFYKAWLLLQRSRNALPVVQHINLLPPGWSSLLLLTVAILGLIIPPRAFASQTALQRGVNDSITLTRVKPQSFQTAKNPENKTLIEWIRELQVRPEPDLYTGQKAKLQGFVVHPPNLPQEYFLLTRFVITCCAADVYPVSLPVKVKTGDRNLYKPDSWLEVQGQMITETLDNKRQVVIQETTSQSIPEPKNPYDS
ncbi:TIGR03943 family protein [Alkalinema sp. FACHB-956]|uniref:TIGR03943 family putative permease subunit n=1 Tax=Alkalinema sp. FACHB-956 TaxID=2692768 RepID=UPI0016824749|nr:TIGR03943 family protein [Alkalinema sp. FACHB-956]MBD2325443.1 TIGR03943 family protein [Alkalinema sp. FACHB-956]